MKPDTLRDAVEADLTDVFAEAFRQYLTVVRNNVGAPASRSDLALTAAAPQPERSTLGEFLGWWQTIVDRTVVDAVHRAWQRAYRETSAGRIVQTSLDAAADYMAAVRDRLVHGIQPPIAEQAFDAVRTTVAQSVAEGWSTKDLSRRLGAVLDWETDESYWRTEQTRYDHEIDRILDRYGPPGSADRDRGRRTDPDVSRLQEARSHTILERERSESTWKTRADRIARTEATGATNFAALRALIDEGWTHKQWLATNDARTRPDHAAADGQTVPVLAEFTVGGSSMQIPGDPSAPAAETVNCRCTLIGVDQEETPDPTEAPPTADTPTGTSDSSGSTAARSSLADKRVQDLTDDEVQSELERLMSEPDGFEDPRMERLAREMDARDYERQQAADRAADLQRQRAEAAEREAWGNRPWRRGSTTRQLREEYDTFIEVQYLQAEAELNGVLLSAEGKKLQAAGDLDVRDLFTRKRRSLRYASEELQEWFSRHPRMSFPEFRGGATDDDPGRAARKRGREHGWESEFG